MAWSDIVVRGGFKHFYDGWSDYLPGYVYVLWLLGKIRFALQPVPFIETLLYKLPAILADLATGYIIYKIVDRLKNKKTALIAASLFIFNPAILANSTLWGQVDSITSLFSLLAVYLANSNWVVSALALALGAGVKPQAALAAIPVLFVMVRNKWPLSKIIFYVLLSAVIFAVLFIPFLNSSNLLKFIQERMTVTLTQYPYTSINAFNFWGLFGLWEPDSPMKQFIGYIATAILGLIFIFRMRKVTGAEYHLLALLLLANFLFFTRMHERHLLPALAPLVISVAFLPSLFISYAIFSMTYLANLRYSYVWITEEFKTIFKDEVLKGIIAANLIGFIYFLKGLWTQNANFAFLKRLNKPEKPENFIKIKFVEKHKRSLLIGILIWAFLTRTISLSSPPNEYFDEVYHAFTARRLLHNDIKVWEWWNPSPEGFAYEWTHPPFAKLAMWAGMKVVGENSLGWRLPAAILGTATVFLIYKLAKDIFKDEGMGLLSAAVYSLDGLPLVMSRIGMNDTYFLFFTILGLYLFLKNKNLFAALCIGLAASSKWSTLYALPILFAMHFLLKKKIRLSYLWFIVLPPLVYLASYIPMFTSGHSLEIFKGMQQQMWWYHTQLKATHPYTSSWWTWPILYRPIWLYTSGEINGMIANIYDQGNPIIFWFGIGSVFVSLWTALKERKRKLALIVFSYFIFFAPWALSPRIMFLYHYLPSIPFMCIAIAYVIRNTPKYAFGMLLVAAVVFIYFYPHWTGIRVPVWLDNSYYWFPSWR